MSIDDHNVHEVKEVVASKILAAAPASAPAQTSIADQTTVLPRQLWVAGLSTVVAGVILKLLTVYAGIDFVGVATFLGVDPTLVQTVLAGIIGLIIARYTPPSVKDLIQNLNDDVVQKAMKDPKSDVSYVQMPVMPPADEPATIPPAKS